MIKPIFRWTMYETNRTGFDILIESLIKTPLSLGIDTFNYIIAYNGKDPHLFEYLKTISRVCSAPVRIIKQKESEIPIPVNRGSLVSMWKCCPARLNIETHEIIADNDLIITKPFPKIDEFLKSNRTLLLKDPIRFYGKLDFLHEKNEFFNSGLIGLPPGYDFARSIKETWLKVGRIDRINYDEEQALLTYCLRQNNPIMIELDEIKELLSDGVAANNHRLGTDYHFTGNEYGFHFVEGNRTFHHRQWERYKHWCLLKNKKISLL